MVLRLIGGLIVAEGEYQELAAYTGLLLQILKAVAEHYEKENARKEAGDFMEFMNKSFADLMRQEMNEKPDESGKGEKE